MSSNGVNGHGSKGGETLSWKLGLVNSAGKFLTAETFGFKINASGQTLRKKQMWIIEHDPTDDEVVYVKSHLGRYLAGDKKGEVTCNSEEQGEAEKFILSYHSDGSGRWAIQNRMHKYFFGGSEDTLRCYEKAPTATEWWTPYLAVHPQVTLRSTHRKTYAHLAESGEIHCNERVPWGQDALITLEYINGKYAVRTCDNRYLTRMGTLVNKADADSLFTFEIRSGQFAGMALKDCKGAYITAVGTNGCLKSRDKAAKSDIVFQIEDSHPQVFITAHNGKKVSMKQGRDLSANQDEITDSETFQIEYCKASKQWRIRTCDPQNEYWSVEQASGIQAVHRNDRVTSLFSFEWLEDGQAAIKASNGRYLNAKLNGSLQATSDSVDDKSRFTLTVINRPILVLRCDYGFMGAKTAGSNRIECNKSSYDVFSVEHCEDGSPHYYIKGPVQVSPKPKVDQNSNFEETSFERLRKCNIEGVNGLYWSIKEEGLLNADSSEKTPFRFELIGQSRFLIKAANDKYLQGEQNGIITAKADLTKGTHWEY